MPQKRIRIVDRALMRLFRVSIFVEKMGKNIAPRLVFFKKARKLENSKLLKHNDSYAFLKEYEFSPSNTPLFQRHRWAFKKRSLRGIYSVIFLCRCLGDSRAEGDEFEGNTEWDDYALEQTDQCSDFGEQDDSVDRRAEMFIHWFYEEMRIQGQ